MNLKHYNNLPDWLKEIIHENIIHIFMALSIIISIFIIQKALAILLGENLKLFDQIPISYLFDLADLIVLIRFFFKLIFLQNVNNVTFTISTLKPNTNYLIKKDGAAFAAVQADPTGKITFSNSVCSAHTFIVEEPPMVSGTVTNKTSGAPIAGATVTDGVKTNVTDASRYFFLDNITAGSRTITASKTGYQSASKTVTVIENSTVTVDFQLDPLKTVPSAPQNLVAVPGDGNVSLSWQAPSNDGGSAITNYKVYRNGTLIATIGNVSAYANGGLTNGITYSYQISAVNSIGEGAKSTAVTAMPAPAPTLSPTVYDNRLRQGSPNTVLGSDSFIDIGNITGTGSYRDVIWFNLSMYNKTTKITSANLSLFWYYNYTSNPINQSIAVDIYRPLDWNQSSVNWNNRTSSTPWSSPGGDWFDRNNASQGSAPFASMTFTFNSTPDNRYYDFNVTELLKRYISGAYNNTGFFLKARNENDNYIAFYSSDWNISSQRPRLAINYTIDAGVYQLDMDTACGCRSLKGNDLS